MASSLAVFFVARGVHRGGAGWQGAWIGAAYLASSASSRQSVNERSQMAKLMNYVEFRRFSSALIAGSIGSLGFVVSTANFSGFIPIIATVLSFASGMFFGEIFARAMLSFVRVRKFLLGGDFVEGHWLLETFARATNVSDPSNPITETGILHLFYDPSSENYKASTVRYDMNQKRYVTNSNIVHIQKYGSNLRYLNYFRLSYNEQMVSYGVSHGEFIKLSTGSSVTHFEAQIFTASEEALHQNGVRLRDQICKEYERKYGGEWMYKAIEELSSTYFDVPR